MENVRFGTVATEVARPNRTAWDLPAPGDWFSPRKEPVGQSEDDMKTVVNRAAKRFAIARGE